MSNFVVSDRHMIPGAAGWMIKYAKRNYWRVAYWYDIDDLISEGFEFYYYMKAHYPQAVDPPHIMRLYQLTFISRVNDLAKRRTKTLEVNLTEDTIPDFLYELPDTLIADAPQPVKKLLEVLTNEDAKRLRAPYRIKGKHRETTNERFCRLIGMDPSQCNIVSLLKNYLQIENSPQYINDSSFGRHTI